MASWLVKMGIPKHSILIDRCSYDTMSNLRYIYYLLNRKSENHVLCIGSPLHLFRINYLARKNNYEISIFPCHNLVWSFKTWKTIQKDSFLIFLYNVLDQNIYLSLLEYLRNPDLDFCNKLLTN